MDDNRTGSFVGSDRWAVQCFSRKVHHQAHWARRIGLRACGPQYRRERGNAQGQAQKPTAGKFHGVPPSDTQSYSNTVASGRVRDFRFPLARMSWYQRLFVSPCSSIQPMLPTLKSRCGKRRKPPPRSGCKSVSSMPARAARSMRPLPPLRAVLTPFEDPYRPSPDVLCYELHGVVLRLLGKTT